MNAFGMSGEGRSEQLISWVLVLISAPFLLGALLLGYQSALYRFDAERAEGQVVEVSSGVPTLTVEYQTADGQTRRLESAGSDLYSNYVVGDSVRVFYDREQPAKARPDLFVDMWLFPIILLVFGGFFGLFVFLVGFPRIMKRDLAKVGVPVNAEYLGWRLALDRTLALGSRGGSIELSQRGSEVHLIHNGRTRDAMDPSVQRELGIGFVVRARGSLPGRSSPLLFDSQPLSENPERRVRSGQVRVYVDPKNPDHYVFEPPFGPGVGQNPGAVR